ncbi:MAG: ribonuclease Z [Butyrivibrio sp.]|nr:ribonuclease Z [Butyrivibrio sp.]
MLDLCLLGTGGMMPLPGRWTTSLITRYNGSSLLIDCGEGTQVAMKKAGWSFKPVDIICFTHFHADHIAGLPGFLLTMGNAERTEDLLIIGPRGVESVVNSLRVIAPDLPFKIKFRELTESRETVEVNGYVIDAFKVQHKVTCYGYSISIRRQGRFDAEEAKRLGIPLPFWNRLQKGETVSDGGNVYTPEMVLGPPRKGIKVTYCTDSRPVPVIAENAAGSDLFICEGMYGEDGKEGKAREYKHMTVYEAAALARDADAQELWLTHYSPSMVKPDEYLDRARAVFPRTKMPRDGWVKTIDFTD